MPVLYPFSEYTCRVSEQLLPAAATGLRIPDRAATAQSNASSGYLVKESRVSILTSKGRQVYAIADYGCSSL